MINFKEQKLQIVLYSISRITETMFFAPDEKNTPKTASDTVTVSKTPKLQLPVPYDSVKTALNITRKKSFLGFAVQQLQEQNNLHVNRDDIITLLSGKIAGVQIKSTGNLWGSSDIIVRGHSSMAGNNQALFVIDGIPLDNTSMNRLSQLEGKYGYDYGNIISDIHPGNIESINVLKGAAAFALYGSRGTNGVILVTTKTGSKERIREQKIGVHISSGIIVGTIDKSTFPRYQKEYGAGYGLVYSDSDHPGFYYDTDVNNDGKIDYVVPFAKDASLGEKFDPNVLVYQFDAAEPSSPDYMQKTPWKAAVNGPETFFQSAVNHTNRIAINGHAKDFNFRVSYSNMNRTGILPNSSYRKNDIGYNGEYTIFDNLILRTRILYNESRVKGRNATGYNDNILTSFRQFYQVNVDLKRLDDLYKTTNRNITWNRTSFDDPTPSHWNNPFWTRYNNYATDKGNHLIGAVQAEFAITKDLRFTSQYSFDNYNISQEERKAIGSTSGAFGVGGQHVNSGYSRFTRDSKNANLNLLVNYTKIFNNRFYVNTNLGYETFRNLFDNSFVSTNGGLVIPEIYSLNNSVDSNLLFQDSKTKSITNSYFGFITLGFNNLVYFDGTYRHEALPLMDYDEIGTSYYSVSGSFLFDRFIRSEHVNFGKFRLNYAKLGHANPSGSSYLLPERTNSYEMGLEMFFYQNRLGFDLTIYKNVTDNQLLPMQVNPASGISVIWRNLGEIENKGIELILNFLPVKKTDFEWSLNLNWAKNNNKVISISKDITRYMHNSFQGGIYIGATKGDPLGTILGNDFTYNSDGRKIIDQRGYYTISSGSYAVIGNLQPDWISGLLNKFRYKNITAGFLLDMNKGGDIFSLDLFYGMGTGLYPETIGNNELGNPKRNPVTYNDDGTYAQNTGGILLEGVQGVDEDGDGDFDSFVENTTRIPGNDIGAYGWSTNPHSRYIYDATYVKLREASITYRLKNSILDNTFIDVVDISLVGSNLWIIHKNLPYSDPEASHSIGNFRGWQSGVMPQIRNFGATLNVYF